MSMPEVATSRLARLACLALATAAAGLLIAGCDASEDADLERGRQLFQAQCGTCHALDEAGTAARVGPDLDAAFAAARADGMDQDTIEGVVQAQIARPRETDPQDPAYMPADLVTGRDAEDVAAYVASIAGVPGIEPPELPPAQIFAEQCGQCHTLQAAGTQATVGPNLDQVLPGQSESQVRQSIVDPNAEITQGFEAGIMPTTFGDSLSQEDLQGLVRYLLESAGGSGAG